jgi:hypothetical protein
VQLGVLAFLVTLAAEWPLLYGLALGLIVTVVPAIWTVMRTVRVARQCSLSVSDAGLVEQRFGHRVSCYWDDVVEVQARRWLGGLFRQETLLLRYSSVEKLDYRGKLRNTIPSVVKKRGQIFGSAWTSSMPHGGMGRSDGHWPIAGCRSPAPVRATLPSWPDPRGGRGRVTTFVGGGHAPGAEFQAVDPSDCNLRTLSAARTARLPHVRFAQLFGSRPSPGDVPTQHIAALVEAVTTARTSVTDVYFNGAGGKIELHETGFVDYANHLAATHRSEDEAEHLVVGPDILHRLSEAEQRETGKTWRWAGNTRGYGQDERAETVASIRLHVAEPRAVAVETLDGERLHRYTFRVRAGRDHEDAVIARMYEHLRHHQIARVVFDVWLNDDGQLRRTREHGRLLPAAQSRYKPIAWTTDQWDFGIATGITVPSPAQILRPPDTTCRSEADLPVAWDGRS